MLKVHVRGNSHSRVRFTVPVPYSVIRICLSLLSSKQLWRWINKAASKKQQTDLALFFPKETQTVLKTQIKTFLKEVKPYRGLTLVDVRSKDGSHVKIKL